jgi:hypothetical protein
LGVKLRGFMITEVVMLNSVGFDPLNLTLLARVAGNVMDELPIFFNTKDLENLLPLGTVPKSVKLVSEGVVDVLLSITTLLPLTSNSWEKLLILAKSNIIRLIIKLQFLDEVILIII